MNLPLEFLASTASVMAGLLSVASTVFAYLRNRKNERDKLRRAQEKEFEAVSGSSDINVLGQYLDETLGQFNVHEYTSSQEVEKRVNKYLEKIQEFVGTTEAVSREEKPERLEEIVEPVEGVSGEFQTVVDELRLGETWNAPARLRRHIEITLRAFAQKQGFKDRQLKSAGQILKILYERKYIDPKSHELLRYSISVCNRAVHGVEVSSDEAEQAIYLTVQALGRFERANQK